VNSVALALNPLGFKFSFLFNIFSLLFGKLAVDAQMFQSLNKAIAINQSKEVNRIPVFTSPEAFEAIILEYIKAWMILTMDRAQTDVFISTLPKLHADRFH